MEFLRAFWQGFRGRVRDGERPSSMPRRASRDLASATDAGGVIKEPPMEIDARVMTAEEFVHYVEMLDFPQPLPDRVFLHHTWRPTRAEWRGRASIMALKAFYETQRWWDDQGRLHEGWTAGPHLFIADDGIWLFSDLRYDGVGVLGHNERSRHIEMVGNCDQQLPTGPTLTNTIAALGILYERLGLTPQGLSFHRDFSNKSCPGWAVKKEWIIPQIETWLQEYRRAKQEELSTLRRSLTRMVQDALVPTNPNAALAKASVTRGLLGALSDEVSMEIDDEGYVVQFFVEALIVPAHQWNDVRSLMEFERDRSET